MNKGLKVCLTGGLLFMIISGSSRLYAQEDVEGLKREIERLKKRVEQLEKKEKPTSNLNRQWRQRDPFEDMRRMQEEMDQLMNETFLNRHSLPSENMFIAPQDDFELKETDTEYIIEYDITGLDKEKIDIQIDQYSITLSGQYSTKSTEEHAKGFFRSESFGSFNRTIPLPVDADTAKLKSDKVNNLLVIKIPKKS